MKLNNVRTVFWKEVVDSVRDSRTIFLMIALPLIIYPALFTGMGYFERSMRQKQEEAAISLAVVNADDGTGLVSFLGKQEKLHLVVLPKGQENDAGRMIREKIAKVALVVPKKFEAALENGRSEESKCFTTART